jgi:hypothetical protein
MNEEPANDSQQLKQELNHNGGCGQQQQLHACASCHATIDDKYLLNLMNMYWHEECLICSQCNCLLDQTCFFKNGQLFCKDDYYKYVFFFH